MKNSVLSPPPIEKARCHGISLALGRKRHKDPWRFLVAQFDQTAEHHIQGNDKPCLKKIR